MSNTHKYPSVKRLTRDRILNAVLSTIAWLMVAAGVAFGIRFIWFSNSHEETNDAQIDQYVTPVAARVTGYIQAVNYTDNQYVHTGDTLVIIENSEYVIRLAKAQAELANAQNNAVIAQREEKAIASTIPVRQAQREAAQAELWRAEQEYKRYSNLLNDEAVSGQQYENAKSVYDEARAHFKEAEGQEASAQLLAGEAQSKVAASAALIAVKQAERDNAALFLSYTVITAPYNGWVGRKAIMPGQLVKEGQTLVQVVSLETWVTANFKETQLIHLQPGKKVVVQVDAFKHKTFTGVITSISPASGSRFSLLPPDNSTGNFVKIEQRVPIRIDFADTTGTAILRAGMNAIVTAND